MFCSGVKHSEPWYFANKTRKNEENFGGLTCLIHFHKLSRISNAKNAYSAQNLIASEMFLQRNFHAFIKKYFWDSDKKKLTGAQLYIQE